MRPEAATASTAGPMTSAPGALIELRAYEDSREPRADHRQADSGDAEQLAHHDLVRRHGGEQDLGDPVRLLLDGVVEQHLHDA